jgi:hypothetical protein
MNAGKTKARFDGFWWLSQPVALVVADLHKAEGQDFIAHRFGVDHEPAWGDGPLGLQPLQPLPAGRMAKPDHIGQLPHRQVGLSLQRRQDALV